MIVRLVLVPIVCRSRVVTILHARMHACRIRVTAAPRATMASTATFVRVQQVSLMRYVKPTLTNASQIHATAPPVVARVVTTSTVTRVVVRVATQVQRVT